ncbi:MAG TPA: hypothetical protein VJS92_08995, partial [Candidatus Polarisedimenticolaceae bacterium]|nr:hypothetical protein [Candidatus Polarisedimenticolaceae bacterium]
IALGGRQVLAPGRAAGPLVGGNLCVLVSTLGTPYAPRFDGAVLLLEDVGEEVYRVDRMLQQLRLAGALAALRGVLLGGLDVVPRRRKFPPDRPLLDVLREVFLPLRVPVVAGLPCGHVPGNRSVPLGGRAAIDTARREVRFEP